MMVAVAVAAVVVMVVVVVVVVKVCIYPVQWTNAISMTARLYGHLARE